MYGRKRPPNELPQNQFVPLKVWVWHTKTEVSFAAKPQHLERLNLTVALRQTNLLNLYAEIVMH